MRRLTPDGVGFAEALLDEQKVAIMPGEALGTPGHIRLGYIADDVATLRDGVRRIIAFGAARHAQTHTPARHNRTTTR